jgi:peptidoglycan/LPS O-acetylase OafA/YrhL
MARFGHYPLNCASTRCWQSPESSACSRDDTHGRSSVGALVAVFVVRPEWFPLFPNIGVFRELSLLFALGSIAYIWRAALPLSLAGLGVALALIVVNPAGIGRGVLFDPLLTYALLTIAYHPALQWRAFNGLGDYSYGLYIYSFPIQQTIVYVMPEASPMLLFAMAMLITLVVAALSWHMVEKAHARTKIAFPPNRPVHRECLNRKRCASSPAPTTTIRTRCRWRPRVR